MERSKISVLPHPRRCWEQLISHCLQRIRDAWVLNKRIFTLNNEHNSVKCIPCVSLSIGSKISCKIRRFLLDLYPFRLAGIVYRQLTSFCTTFERGNIPIFDFRLLTFDFRLNDVRLSTFDYETFYFWLVLVEPCLQYINPEILSESKQKRLETFGVRSRQLGSKFRNRLFD